MRKTDYPCAWAPINDPLYRAYHDTEWGVPIRDSQQLWAKLQLDGMQAGLSWITILRKRETILEAFEGLDPHRLANWDDNDIENALTNPGIIRSRAKTRAVVGNARAYLNQMAAGEDFSQWCWAFVNDKPLVGRLHDYKTGPTQNEISVSMTKALKKQGYKFVGPTIVYAWMQAVGMINDHEITCQRFAEINSLS